MAKYADLFERTGDPADETRLTEIEHALGRQLPDDYRALIRETGGGTLKLAKCVMPGLPEGVGRLATDDIFGNGTTEATRTFDLATYATFLMEEWEIPDEVLLFATTEDGMHNCFVINYDLPDFPTGSVLYLDTDPDGEKALVAKSFDDFFSQLEPYPSNDAPEEVSQDGIGIKGVRYGVLSEPLQRAISVNPTPDIEKLLRKATEPITNDLGPGITGDTPESRLFYDVVYWIVQHVEPQHDPRTYDSGGRKGQEITFEELIGESFKVPGQKYGLGYTLASIIMWWNRRVEEGVLKETPDGFLLDEDYITSVLNGIRKEEH